MPSKWIRETVINASLIPHPDVNAALPGVNVLVNMEWYSALIHAGCPWSIFSVEQCRLWTRNYTDVETGVLTFKTINIFIYCGNPTEAQVLVEQDRLLGFDPLARINSITTLGDINIID